MKKFLLPFFLVGCFSLQAQNVKEWLSLTPVAVEQPAFNQTKNVRNLTFTPSMQMKHTGINIRNLVPEEGRQEKGCSRLQWNRAKTFGDTLAAPQSDRLSLCHFATYFTNSEWLSGKFSFHLSGQAEVYIDGKKVAESDGRNCVRQAGGKWTPGKHLLLVKTLTRGGRVLHASFQADRRFKDAEVVFDLSPKHGKTILEILNSTNVSCLKLSASGRYALIGLNVTREGKATNNIYLYRVDDKKLLHTFYGQSVSGLQWIPGTEELSFLQSEGNGMSLYSYNVETQEQKKLIRNDRQIRKYTWAPDRSYLLYYTNESYGDPKWRMRKLDGVQDRQSYFRNRSFLCRYDFATGMHSRLTWGNLSTTLMDISPDASKLLVTTSRPVYDQYPFNRQNIFLIDVNTMETDTLFTDLEFGISCQFSPDGRKLLAKGGASAFGKEGENIGRQKLANQYDNQLYVYDLDTRKVEYITRDFAPSVDKATWHTDGRIYAQVTDADFMRLYSYDGKEWKRLECPGDQIRFTAFADHSSRLMFTSVTTDTPNRIYDMDLESGKATLWDNPCKEECEHIVCGEMKDWDYRYNKNTLIDGRYYLPADFDPNKKYPMIVYYYGGTTPVTRSYGGRWPFNLYTAHGYVVYVLQPSGTIGYGQEFSARHQNNWCKITADEIISSVKAFLKAHPFVDPERVGCMGASYGGFTTEYLTTRTNIFACAISHAGISAITGYWGEGYWGYGYSANASGHSYPWNRKDIYVDQSPLYNADKVKVPILLIHGTKDVNVPTGQSIQFYTALKILGKDAELVFVKDADHAVVDYDQRILWNNTIMSYFAKYLQGKPAWWEDIYKDLNL